MNIISLAFDLAETVEQFIQRVRLFYYHVMLFGHACPHCQGQLSMIAESKCLCDDCGQEFDPTEEFQRCTACGGKIKLRIRRYQCRDCGQDVQSRFLFDGLVFNREYFAARMSESRQRKKEQRERVRQMLAESRSAVLPLEPLDFDAVPGLLEALNSLTASSDSELAYETKAEFDLGRYERHIKAHVRHFSIRLTDIPPLGENSRKDLIWRFIAVIFLAHAGLLHIWEDGTVIMVKRHAIDRKRQGVPGEAAEADGFEGSMGGVEAG